MLLSLSFSRARLVQYAMPFLAGSFLSLLVLVQAVSAQQETSPYSTRNIHLVSHHPLGGTRAVAGETSGGFESLGRRTGNLVIEQAASRPFVYVTREHNPSGFVAIDLSTPSKPKVAYEWSFSSSHDAAGATDITYFKIGDRFFLVMGVQFSDDDPDNDLAAIVFDVTDLGQGKVTETARIRRDGGYHHLFAYRHSDGRSILFATGGGPIDLFDLKRIAQGNAELFASMQIPETIANVDYGFYSMQAAYHAESETDRLYTSGAGGYYVYNITDPVNANLIATVSSAAIQIGHEVAPTPDGMLLVTTAGYRASPVRIFSLSPAYSESPAIIKTALGAWVANWKNRAQSVAIRWPFLFVASTEDGFQAVNMRNPLEPYTAGYYQTWTGKSSSVSDASTDRTGAWDIDVRNRDGLVVVSDVNTGLWAFRMDAFQGWDGRGWGFPNVSSVQDWDNGPVNSVTWPADE